jgi:hypothetical protein
MIALLSFFLILLVSPLKSKSRLEAENAALRHQLIVLRRKVRGRVQLTNGDRLLLVLLYRWFPSVLKTIRSSGPRRSCVGIGPSLLALEIPPSWSRPQIDAGLRARLGLVITDVPELTSVAGDAGMEILGPPLSDEEVRQIIAEVGAS